MPQSILVVNDVVNTHVINTRDDTDFGGKVDFCEGRKTGKNPWSQIEINQSQLTYKPRIERRSQWWEARMMSSVPT